MTIAKQPIDATIRPLRLVREPYVNQGELVSDQIRAMRARIHVVIGYLRAASESDDAEQKWPSDLLAAESAIEARIDATADRSTLAILRLRDRFQLSLSEERILWLLISAELCPTTRRLMRATATEDTCDPTTDMIRRAVYGDGYGREVWRELSEQSTLRRYSFIERTDTKSDLPEHRQTWKVARRVLALVHGELEVDETLLQLVEIALTPSKPIEQLEVCAGAVDSIERAFERRGLIVVHGRVGQGRRSALTAVAAARGLSVLNIRSRAISNERDIAQTELRAVARECRLLDLVPLFRDVDALSSANDGADRLELLEQEFDGLVLATSSRPVSRRWKRAPASIELEPLSSAQRTKLWGHALRMAAPEDAEILATMYPLAPALIEAAATAAIEQSGSETMRPEHIANGMRTVLDDRLAGLAMRVTVTQTWNDLVLPDDQVTAVSELLARIRERGRVYEQWGFAKKVGKGLGVSALFSGPPGTGKTMAAGLVARALNTELYQVDLSKIVSKWIGETEKNLAALFDAAEAGHAILLFDEADALFGKRTDVRSSNDRHANQEVNFLLQRLESYAGICILTTNHETAIDDAFRRRLSVHVRFPMPEVDERKRLWRAMIPANAPTSEELPLDELATKYVMSGGYIKNAVLRAAFLAADEEGLIDAGRLSRAAQLEYEGMGKLVFS